MRALIRTTIVIVVFLVITFSTNPKIVFVKETTINYAEKVYVWGINKLKTSENETVNKVVGVIE